MKVSPLVLIKDLSLWRTDSLIDGQAAADLAFLFTRFLPRSNLTLTSTPFGQWLGSIEESSLVKRSSIAGYAIVFRGQRDG
jgi:hypothetical protein